MINALVLIEEALSRIEEADEYWRETNANPRAGSMEIEIARKEKEFAAKEFWQQWRNVAAVMNELQKMRNSQQSAEAYSAYIARSIRELYPDLSVNSVEFFRQMSTPNWVVSAVVIGQDDSVKRGFAQVDLDKSVNAYDIAKTLVETAYSICDEATRGASPPPQRPIRIITLDE